MVGVRRRDAGIVFSATLVLLVMLWVAAVPRAAARTGLLSHYELCEGSDWASLDSVRVDGVNGDVWTVAGVLSTRVLHVTTTGNLIGSTDGSDAPVAFGFGNSFGLSPRVAFTRAPHELFVADRNGPYANNHGRLLDYSPARSPTFQRQFMIPNRIPPGSGFNIPVEALGVQRDGQWLVLVLDGDRIVAYRADGTYLATMFPQPGFDSSPDNASWTSGSPGGLAAVNSLLYVSDPRRGKVKAYSLEPGDPSKGEGAFVLSHDGDITAPVGRIASGNDGTFWGANSQHLLHYSATGTLIEDVPIEGIHSVAVSTTDGNVWVTRSDGLFRLGEGGDTVPGLQDHWPNVCGPPRISRSITPVQRIFSSGALDIVAKSDEPCRLLATSTLTTPSPTRTFALRPTIVTLAATRSKHLSLRFTSSALKALKKTLQHRRRAVLQITLLAADTGGTVARQQFQLTLG